MDQRARLLLPCPGQASGSGKRHRAVRLEADAVVDARVAHDLRNERIDAITLVLLEHRVAARREHQHRAGDDRQVPHARACRQEHHQERGPEEERAVQVRLQHDEPHRDERHDDGGQHAVQPLHRGGGAHPCRHRQHPGELDELAWLEIEASQVDPAPRAVARADDRIRHERHQDEHQERRVDREHEPRPAAHPAPVLRAHEGRHQHADDQEPELPLRERRLGGGDGRDAHQAEPERRRHRQPGPVRPDARGRARVGGALAAQPAGQRVVHQDAHPAPPVGSTSPSPVGCAALRSGRERGSPSR